MDAGLPRTTAELSGLGDDALLDAVQRRTFDFFWSGAHPSSGCARDRQKTAADPANDLIAVGGTGFGVMALAVGVSRGWIGRADWVCRMGTILDFLERADRFHGAFPHFLHGITARAIPMRRKDDGADLVETALLFQGLLAARELLDAGDPREDALRRRIDALWEAVEWSWFEDGQGGLSWHWSPKYGFDIGLKITGWNEALIAYVLAAASPTHPVGPETYHRGFARDGATRNGRRFYGIELPLGIDAGGPLFIAHFSFCGLDPRGLSDRYADYWAQNVAHARINHAHCVANPGRFAGYGADCWGLSACHARRAYNVYSPADDAGVIAPAAALASFPYLPRESMEALRGFARRPHLWGRFGLVDSFSETQRWAARSYLAVNQGPVVAMIENHRSGLLWKLFMGSPEAKRGLQRLGFESPWLGS